MTINADFSTRQAKLSAAKRELLAKRLRGKTVTKHNQNSISPQSRDTNQFPVSFSQQRLWFLDQLEPGSNAYNLSAGTVRFKGELNVAALEKTLNALVVVTKLLELPSGQFTVSRFR